LFAFVDERDKQQRNWICRALWISNRLTGSLRPKALGGKDCIGDIELEWSKMRQVRRDTLQRCSKREWFESVDELLPKMAAIVERIKDSYDALKSGSLEGDRFFTKMARFEEENTAIHQRSLSTHVPPLECAIAHQSFQQVLTSCFNITVPFRKQESKWTQMDWHMKTYLEQYDQDLQRLTIDLERIR